MMKWYELTELRSSSGVTLIRGSFVRSFLNGEEALEFLHQLGEEIVSVLPGKFCMHGTDIGRVVTQSIITRCPESKSNWLVGNPLGGKPAGA